MATDDAAPKYAALHDDWCLALMAFFLHQGSLAMPYFEHDDDPKKPRPVNASKKTEGVHERTESRKDDDRDFHRHVHVRC